MIERSLKPSPCPDCMGTCVLEGSSTPAGRMNPSVGSSRYLRDLRPKYPFPKEPFASGEGLVLTYMSCLNSAPIKGVFFNLH